MDEAVLCEKLLLAFILVLLDLHSYIARILFSYFIFRIYGNTPV